MLTPVYLNSSGSNSDENHKLETISQLHFFLFLLRIGKEREGEGICSGHYVVVKEESVKMVCVMFCFN